MQDEVSHRAIVIPPLQVVLQPAPQKIFVGLCHSCCFCPLVTYHWQLCSEKHLWFQSSESTPGIGKPQWCSALGNTGAQQTLLMTPHSRESIKPHNQTPNCQQGCESGQNVMGTVKWPTKNWICCEGILWAMTDVVGHRSCLSMIVFHFL